MKIKTFKKSDGKTYRIIGRWSKEYWYGYTEADDVLHNILQVKHWLWGWLDVERERVPSFAWISQMTLGYADWKSDLIERNKP